MEETFDVWDRDGEWEELADFSRQGENMHGNNLGGASLDRGKAHDGQRMETEDTPQMAGPPLQAVKEAGPLIPAELPPRGA